MVTPDVRTTSNILHCSEYITHLYRSHTYQITTLFKIKNEKLSGPYKSEEHPEVFSFEHSEHWDTWMKEPYKPEEIAPTSTED